MNTSRRSLGHRGFTSTEMVVVTCLTVLLVTILGSVYSSFCRPTVDVLMRCRIAQEADFALGALTKDLSGTLADSDGRLGGPNDGKLVDTMTPESLSLRLCFHDGPTDDLTPLWTEPDTVISYSMYEGQLFRFNEKTGTSIVVADLVTSFEVEPLAAGNGVAITLTFGARNLSMTYSMVALSP